MDFFNGSFKRHRQSSENHMALPTAIKKTCWGKWAGKRKNITTNSEERCSPKDNLIINLTAQELQPHEVILLNKLLLFYAPENLLVFFSEYIQLPLSYFNF